MSLLLLAPGRGCGLYHTVYPQQLQSLIPQATAGLYTLFSFKLKVILHLKSLFSVKPSPLPVDLIGECKKFLFYIEGRPHSLSSQWLQSPFQTCTFLCKCDGNLTLWSHVWISKVTFTLFIDSTSSKVLNIASIGVLSMSEELDIYESGAEVWMTKKAVNLTD